MRSDFGSTVPAAEMPCRPAAPRPGWAGRHLQRAVLALGSDLADLRDHAEREWASATFAGTRHRLVLHFAGAAAIAAGERFIAALPDHEFALPGQLVADAAIVAVDHVLVPDPGLTLVCELLLLSED